MRIYCDKEKSAIKSGDAFVNLKVHDLKAYQDLFLHPNFRLLEFDDGENKAYIVFEEHQGAFIFHLVNFTLMKTRSMTEEFIVNHAIPFCLSRGLHSIQASAERKGMAKKLKKLGFSHIGNNVFRGQVAHVS